MNNNHFERGLADLMVVLKKDKYAGGCETEGRPYLFGENDKTMKAVLLQADCGLWACPHCAAKNASRWVARSIVGALELAESGKELALLTLTHRGNLSRTGSMYRWRECWPKLSARMRRASDVKPEYLYVHEQHKNGKLHTHFITTDGLGKRWWKDKPAETGFGYMNDWSLLTNHVGAGAYVAKYLAKQLEALNWPKHWRRIATSRGWPTLADLSPAGEYDWTVCKRGWEVRLEIEGAQLQGYTTTIACDVEDILVWLEDYCERESIPVR